MMGESCDQVENAMVGNVGTDVGAHRGGVRLREGVHGAAGGRGVPNHGVAIATGVVEGEALDRTNFAAPTAGGIPDAANRRAVIDTRR